MSNLVTKEELQKKYSTFSDFELLSIIDNQNDYTTVAFEVAKEEIKNRNLSFKHIETYNNVTSQHKPNISEKGIQELSTTDKILYFFSSFLGFLFTLMLHRNLIENGYEYKSRQAKYYSVFGIVLLIFSMIILAILGESILFVPLLILCFYLTYKREESSVERPEYHIKDLTINDIQ